MTNHYYVFSDKYENGQQYAYVISIPSSLNVLSCIAQHKNLYIMHQCDTKRYANELAKEWNKSYKNNGTYGLGIDY